MNMPRSRARSAFSRALSLLCTLALLVSMLPAGAAFAIREGQTTIDARDTDDDGNNDTWVVDWDGDGEYDEIWRDTNGDGTIDSVEWRATDDTRSPRGKPGKTGVTTVPIDNGGEATSVDWEGDGDTDEFWWDENGDGVIEDVDIDHTESKVIDNTRSTRFRGVFVGVRNGLDYPEKDVNDVTGALEQYPASWNAADMTELTGNAATPAAIEAAINAAKADSKPGDEFVFYFSGHGGGYDKDDGYSGGVIDGNGDETAIPIRERDFEADGSDLATPPAGMANGHVWDTNGDGASDMGVAKDSAGNVAVRRFNPGPPPSWGEVLGADTNGDDVVDGADGGVDVNGDGDKDDMLYVDDTLQVAGNVKVTDDQLTTWLSGFPESCTIVVILDSCYSGSFIPDLQRVTDSAGKPLRPGHLECVAAATADDEAWEEPISNGVLTHALVNALKPVDEGPGPGQHTTTVADRAGNSDDITTTSELFSFAGPQATTFHLGDEDGDGVVDEDAIEHGYASVTFEIEGSGVLTESATVHVQTDPDGDGPENFDSRPPAESFFDVWFDPDYGNYGTPRFIQTFGGDTVLSFTASLPGFGATSLGPFWPGDPTTGGKCYQMQVREVPWPYTPEPPAGMTYASPCYNAEMWSVLVTPGLDEEDHSSAELDLAPVEEGWPSLVNATIDLGEWVPPGAPAVMPFVYDEDLGSWEPVPGFYDPMSRRVPFTLTHFSLYALFYVGPPRIPTPTILPPTDLRAVRTGMDGQLLWINPTDARFELTRVFRSTTGYAVDPSGGAGQTQVYEGDGWNHLDEDLAVDTYYYTAFSRDYDGAWSGPATTALDMSTRYESAAGADRYLTSVAASQESYPDGLTRPDPEGHLSVVVATGTNWPDALGGSALAGCTRGPILLVKPTALPTAVAEEIERLGADRAFVLGGTAAVSDGVAAQLDAIPGVDSVERLAGPTRYETAEAIAERVAELEGDWFSGRVFVATGANFPDALAASSIAAARCWPLYLCAPTGLRQSTKDSMDDLGITDSVILGGTAVVSAATETYLDSVHDSVERLAGANRYETAVEVAGFGTDTLGMSWRGTGISTGTNFPDALAGGVLIGRRGSVMLLTQSASLSPATRTALTTHRDDVSAVTYLGGTAAVSQAVRDEIEGILR